VEPMPEVVTLPEVIPPELVDAAALAPLVVVPLVAPVVVVPLVAPVVERPPVDAPTPVAAAVLAGPAPLAADVDVPADKPVALDVAAVEPTELGLPEVEPAAEEPELAVALRDDDSPSPEKQPKVGARQRVSARSKGCREQQALLTIGLFARVSIGTWRGVRIHDNGTGATIWLDGSLPLRG
jgi:hypothetical protein